MTTREFVLSDYEAVLALWGKTEGIELCEGDSREDVARYLQRNPGLSRVAEEGGALVGAVLCGHDGRRGWIYHLAIAQAWRSKGIGRLLIEECVRGLRQAGIQRALILVSRDNPAGQRFWERNGWEELDFALPMARDISPR